MASTGTAKRTGLRGIQQRASETSGISGCGSPLKSGVDAAMIRRAMNDPVKLTLKERIRRETTQYVITVTYLILFFSLFTWYRRLILAEYGIGYFHYGAAILEAFVLAKVVSVGSILGFGKSLENRSLIIPTIHKTIVFSICVGIVGVLEHAAWTLITGKGVVAGLDEVAHLGRDELIAKCLVTFCAFIPFFAFRELGRVLGEGKIRELFFYRTAATDAGLPVPR